MFRRVNRRSAVYGLLVVVVLCIWAMSPSFGRAEPTANYRPTLGPPALETGCFPLPDGVTFDFPFQVRSDGDVATVQGPRRHLLMQFDEVDPSTARDRVQQAFVRAGFTQTSSDDYLEFRKAGVGRVVADVEPIPGVDDDAVVRGTITLDLPAIAVQSDSDDCSNPYVTKRFDSAGGGS
jgi:hypothetical protein